MLGDKIHEMARQLCGLIQVPIENTSESQRQVLATFAFGMVWGVADAEELKYPDIYGFGLTMLTDVFKYSIHQAVRFMNLLVKCSSPTDCPNAAVNAVMYHGVEGYRQWGAGDSEALQANLQHVLEAISGHIGDGLTNDVDKRITKPRGSPIVPERGFAHIAVE